MKNIRVLHVIGIMNRGGAETMIMNLYRNIDRNKVQFDFVENTQEKGIYENEILSLGGRVFHCPKFNGDIFSYMKWWNTFFDVHENEYAFVHGHIGSTAAMYLLSAKKHGIKTIAHSHSTYAKLFSIKQFQYKILSYPTRYVSDYYFACSKEAGISRYGKKVTFYVVRNSVDSNTFRYDSQLRDTMRNELRLDNNISVFGHVGRFTAEKNHSFILRVFKKICAQMNAVLLLVGDGPLYKEIEKEAKDFGILNQVRFLGVREDIPALMNCMDVMIFPSVREGLPVTLVEAQCSGLHCLISDSISNETVLVKDLVTFLSLNQSEEVWAKKAKELCAYERRSYEKEIADAGYDIKENANWLQNFYLKGGNA
ncbi:MAG: glycosyltransferase family 1 protein [Erysipelotrichaceae bacterium]|nr:glycosyltransferase family 1 protein [Erysipelotrichaceae bacterium]